MNSLAIIGFILMIVLMVVLIKGYVAPPVALIFLPLIAAVVAGFGAEDIGGFIKSGMGTMLSTAVLFVFSISYFTLMDEVGLFDPIINFLTSKAGNKRWMILLSALLVTFVAHLDGSGATTFLIVVPAFLPIFKRMGLRREALLALVMLVFLFLDTPMPLYSIFMISYALALVVNFPNVKTQNAKIKSLGVNAMVMTITLFSVGIFMGVISESGMVEAMATTIVNALPASIAPHMHWFLALFSVPLIMILGTDAFYYAMLPIIIGVVAPFGVSAQAVAATFLLTATFGTPISPSVAAVYVGLGLADVTIGDHIKYSLKLVWTLSIISLVAATLLGVIPF